MENLLSCWEESKSLRATIETHQHKFRLSVIIFILKQTKNNPPRAPPKFHDTRQTINKPNWGVKAPLFREIVQKFVTNLLIFAVLLLQRRVVTPWGERPERRPQNYCNFRRSLGKQTRHVRVLRLSFCRNKPPTVTAFAKLRGKFPLTGSRVKMTDSVRGRCAIGRPTAELWAPRYRDLYCYICV